jgi:hypothetical protein
MPRWRSLCKEDEEPSEFYGTSGFEKEFGIKNAFGPVVVNEDGTEVKDEHGRPVLKWNRCWSDIPKEWGPAIHELLDKIRAKYRVETLEDKGDEPEIQVWIDQIKDKFGSARIYFTTVDEKIDDDIDKMVEECEERLKKDDPFYGIPY